MLAITTCLATKALTFPQAFSAMTNEVLWLIVASFFFAKVRSRQGPRQAGGPGSHTGTALVCCGGD